MCSVQVRKWITDWNLNTEKKHTLLRMVYDALVDCKKRYLLVWFQVSCVQGLWFLFIWPLHSCLSVKLQLKWWWSYWAVTQRTMLHKPGWMHTGMIFSCVSVLIWFGLCLVIYTYALLSRCIVRALKDTNTYLFDHLLALKPVRFLEGELIHDVRKCF